MKVLLTGASGFIGRQCLQHLSASGSEVVAVARRAPSELCGNARFFEVDLMDEAQVNSLMRVERPTHLLHLAWNATPGQYWTTPENLDWVAQSLRMLRSFAASGGRRAVIAGTCAEYDWQGQTTLEEMSSQIKPGTLYGTAKDALRRVSLASSEALGIQTAWGRVFWLYGPHESRGRLVSDIAANLSIGRPVDCSEGRQERDFLHVSDVAGAFVAALMSDYTGAFNIGSGKAVAVRDVAITLGNIFGAPELVRLGALPAKANEPPCLQASVNVLRDLIGFVPRYDLRSGLEQTAGWWRKQAQ